MLFFIRKEAPFLVLVGALPRPRSVLWQVLMYLIYIREQMKYVLLWDLMP